jgi:hypothetical protein
VLAAVVALGAWLGQRPTGRSARAAGNDSLALAVPADWTAARPPSIPGITLERALAFVPRDEPRRSAFVAGLVRGEPPTYAPPVLAARTGAGERALVRLSGGVAYRYVHVAKPMRVLYVLPGPERSIVAACVAADSSGRGLRDCEGVAATLVVRRRAVFDPRPSASFGAAVNAALHVLRPERRNGLSELAKAPTRRAQARWAYATAIGYRTTVASLRRTHPPEIAAGPTRALVRAVGRAGVAYTRLSAAAREGDAARFEALGGDVLRAESRVRAALSNLGALGYGRT